MKISGVATAER